MKSNLKRLRKEADFSQAEFANIMGISQAELSRFENKIRSPSLKLALKMAFSLCEKVEDIWSL